MPGSVIVDTSFRTWQTVADLTHHVKPLLPQAFGALADASGLTSVQTGEALQMLRDDHFSFSQDETFALLDGLEALATAQAEGFELAVVVLLTDLLQTRQGSGLAAEVWAAAGTRLRTWPDTLRAAVANGLRRAVALGLISQEPPPAQDCVTRAAVMIAEPLLRIARAMRPDELDAVVHEDYGNDVARHLAALKHVIRNQNGIFSGDQAWFPAEVVELAAHVADRPGFEGCTALLLLNALAKGDLREDIAIRWPRLGPAYCALRPSARDPVLAGIRHIYESDPGFMDLALFEVSARLEAGVLIPVVHDLT